MGWGERPRVRRRETVFPQSNVGKRILRHFDDALYYIHSIGGYEDEDLSEGVGGVGMYYRRGMDE